MNVLRLLSQPAVLWQIAKKLGVSLLISMLVMAPGFLLSILGFRILGALCLFAGSFFMLARNYRKPWKWNPILAFVPPFVALLGLLLQWTIFHAQFPAMFWTAIAIAAGLSFGWQRGRSHKFYFTENQLMAERTVMFLVIWALCSGLTQLVGLLAWRVLITPGLISGIFSTSMLFAVAIILHRKSKSTELRTPPTSAGAYRMARASAVIMIGFLLGIAFIENVQAANHPRVFTDEITDQMQAIGRQSVDRAAGFCKGLIEQESRVESPGMGSGKTVRIDAYFNVQLSKHVTDSHSHVEFTRFDDAKTARKLGDSMKNVLQPLSVEEKFRGINMLPASGIRGESSYHTVYEPRTGGLAHRAIIQHGQWIIDVDTRNWDPGNQKDREILAVNQSEITYTLASTMFDAGLESGLIDLVPMENGNDRSVPASPTSQSAPDLLSNPSGSQPGIIDIATLAEELPSENDVDPVDVERLTALIALILLAGGMTADAATAIATAIAQGMVEQTGQQLADELPTDSELHELEQAVDDVELDDEENETFRRGVNPPFEEKADEEEGGHWIPNRVARETLAESWDDVKEAGRELAELVPVVLDAALETGRDITAFHPATVDWDRIVGVKDDLLSAGRGLHNIVEGLSQLAGDKFAGVIDQDPNVLAALELLAIVARRAAVPGAAAIDGSDEALQTLLTERRDEVMAGLARIGQLTGKGGYQAIRLTLGAQEWENAVNGDLSPLTRITNALLGSAQTAGVLHGLGSKAASRFASAAEAVDGAADLRWIDDAYQGRRPSVPGYADELADGSRPRQQWPFQTRRNPETGAIEWRGAANEPFQPLPDDVATAMRNKPLGEGQLRMNPDNGSIEWRNPETGKIEKAPSVIERRNPATGEMEEIKTGFQDRRPGYEQTPTRVATGRDADLRNLPGGSVVPDEILPQTGYAPHQLDDLARLSHQENVIFGGRTTNMDSLRHIADGTGTPKPVYIKSKTIQEIDKYLGANPGDKGLVGYFKPNEPNMANVPAELKDAVNARYKLRMEEFNDLRKDIDRMIANKEIAEEGGKLHRVFKDGTTRPFAGDIDPVYIRDAKTGKALAGDRYLEVLEKFKNSKAEIQHGAEFNMSADLLRNSQPGTPEYEKAVRKMAELHRKLEKGHTGGGEIAVEMWPDGKLRRADQLRGLGMEV